MKRIGLLDFARTQTKPFIWGKIEDEKPLAVIQRIDNFCYYWQALSDEKACGIVSYSVMSNKESIIFDWFESEPCSCDKWNYVLKGKSCPHE
jgi:hypothetical protein